MGACYSIWPTRSIPLHIAAAKGSISVAKLLLQAQVGPSAHPGTTSEGPPLHYEVIAS